MSISKTKIAAFSIFRLFLTMAFGGFLLGNLFYLIIPNSPYRVWHFWAEPPGKAIKILPYKEHNIVFVQSADNNIYSCEYGNKCKQIEESQIELRSLPCDHSGSPNFIKPIIFSKVVDSFAYRSCGIDSYADIYLVVLDDGTIWEWVKGERPLRMGIYQQIKYGLIGVFLGMLSGIFIYRAKYR